MIESTFAEHFAKEWIDVRNSHELADGTIKTVPLAEGDPSRELYLIQHKDRYLSRAAKAFVERLLE